jgi:hypothetical protein
MAMRNWRKTGTVVFSGLFFFGYFLLEEQKKVTINYKKKGCLFETPFFFCYVGVIPPEAGRPSRPA